jgi:hypothetical protein
MTKFGSSSAFERLRFIRPRLDVEPGPGIAWSEGHPSPIDRGGL